MKKKHETLYRARGIVDALFWLPTSRWVKGKELDRVFGWQEEYHANGLPLSRMGENNRALRQLVDDGCLSIMGKGRATGHKFTAKGLEVSDPAGELDLLAILLSKVKPLRSVSKENACGYVHGWKLAPNAYKAIFKGENKEEYNEEQNEVEKWLIPAQEMGWLWMHANTTGYLWAVKLTEAGEGAIANATKRGAEPETAEQESGIDVDAATDFWIEGFENTGPRFFRETPEPAWQANMIRRRLSEGLGWSDGE